MEHTLLPLLFTFLVAGSIAVGMLMVSIFLGPKKMSEVKDDPFECGTIGSGSPNQRMSVKFYLVAVIFILFDIEIVFMYPWAVKALALGWYGYIAMMSFVAVLTVGLVYVWKRGVLDWS